MMKLLAASAIVAAQPIVTFQSSVDLATSSASLAIDWVSYSNDKITEALPDEYSRRYKDLRKDLRQYWQTYAGPVVAVAQEKYAAHSGHFIKTIGLVYTQLESLVAAVVDPVIREFELKHPAQAGMIGESLADRLTLIFWIYLIFKGLSRLFFGNKGKACC